MHSVHDVPEVAAETMLDAKRWRLWRDNPRIAKHDYYGAGEKDCPQEIKAGNGELHTLMCRHCRKKNPRNDLCIVAIDAAIAASNPIASSAEGKGAKIPQGE